MATEFELKYLADEKTLEALSRRFPGGRHIAMSTTYYDTRDSGLSARRWTLRRRQENDTFVCTLKTPAGSSLRRGEWEILCPKIEDAVAPLAKKSGLAELADLAAKGLRPVCGARFDRTAVSIAVGSSTAELALDRGELLGNGHSIPLAECEIELKSGSEEEIRIFADALAREYGLIPESRSKFARARALTQEDAHGI